MNLPKVVGENGIWLIRDRHQHSGEFVLIDHPENPLPLSKQVEVEKLLRNCSQ